MYRFSLIAATLLAIGFVVLHQQNDASADESKSPKIYRHVVLFKFKDGVSKEEIKEVEVAFAALPKKISTITDFEWGTDVSVENKTKGFTHCFLVSFRDKKGLETYLPHDAHQAFVKLVGPRLDDVCVIDYWASK